MKIKLFQNYACSNGCFSAGEVIEIEKSLGKYLVESNQVELVEEKPVTEKIIEVAELPQDLKETAKIEPVKTTKSKIFSKNKELLKDK